MLRQWRFVLYGSIVLGAAILLSAAGCSSSSSSSTTSTTTSPAQSGVSFSKDVQPIFNNNCVVCHQGTNGPAGLSLASGAAYSNLVNVKSSESSLMRVAPGLRIRVILLTS